MVRSGLMRLLESNPRFKVVGEAATAPDALCALRQQHADVVLVDLALHRGSGLELIHALHIELPLRRCLVVTMHDEALYAERALRAGARGFIGKDAPIADLFDAVLTVARGERYVSGSMREVMLKRFYADTEPSQDAVASLTDRELEVFRLLGLGLTTRDIATRLGISVKTVETHRVNIKNKLRIEGLGELVRFAVSLFAPCERL